MGDNKIKYKKGYRFITIALVAVFIIVFTSAATLVDNTVLDKVKATLKAFYVDDLPPSVYAQSSVSDVLKEVNKTDPFTKYYTSNKYVEVVNSINNDTSGIGVYIQMVPEGAKVISILNNTPEKVAGILVGDIILMADNQILIGLSQEDAIKYVKGETGETVKLKIKRGSKLVLVDVYRQATPNATMEGQILDRHIGYIKINTFAEDGDFLFSQMVFKYERMKLDSYIIDLRYDTGGYLKTAIDIAGYFVGNNVAIIAKGKLFGVVKYYGKFHGMVINKPVVFLVNQYSKSASEILAAAVKDYNKAYIIGTKTFGKGSIQWAAPLPNGDTLNLTIERFYSPKGATIDKVGISPDLNITDDTIAMKTAQLVLDSPNYLKDKDGYVKINLKNKSITLKLTRAESPSFWQTYKALLGMAATQGSVMLGAGEEWKTVSKSYLSNVAKMYFPNYKVMNKLVKVDIDKSFRINFKINIGLGSYNDRNIELINVKTGKRVPVNFETISARAVVVSPVGNLVYNEKYILVVHPSTLKADDNPLGYGTIQEMQTIKGDL